MPSLESVTYFFFHSLLSEFPLRLSKMPWWRWRKPKSENLFSNLSCVHTVLTDFSRTMLAGCQETPTPPSSIRIHQVSTDDHTSSPHMMRLHSHVRVLPGVGGMSSAKGHEVHHVCSALSENLCPTCLMGIERPLPRSPLQSALLLFESLPLRPWMDKTSSASKTRMRLVLKKNII